MRAGLSTIQQTLTPEAAAVLNQSISEASRRNHGQTTPLHVAATLLNSPSGYLRQACIRSHPNSSHPLQCRTLELCFNVALERLSSAQDTAAPGMEPEPPISNALMAALKRAQAHQRRGCPEQQQQPLLAVKMELDQLIISILDDPSVSRVMREAGFSSPAVKATIEQSLTSSSSNGHHYLHHQHRHIVQRMICNPAQLATPFMQSPSLAFPLANGNSYLNPRLQQGDNAKMGNQRGDEINKLLEIMMRSKKKNPILIGDLKPGAIVKELLKKIENKELGNDGVLKNARVISMKKGVLLDKKCVPSKIKELGGVIENLIGIGGVIVDLGDLKWLVEHQHQQQVITEYGRAAVVDMAELLTRFGGDGENEDNNKVWLIGTATCETYLRCLIYYSTMESDWDLQTVPMGSRSRFPGMFPRLGTERFSSDPLEPLNPVKAVHQTPVPALTRRAYEKVDPSQRTTTFCLQCSGNYEKELKKLEANEKSFSEATQPSLPQWLQNAKLNATDSKIADKAQDKDHGLVSEQKTKELQKKWRDMCLHLHPNFHQTCRAEKPYPPILLSMAGLYDPNLLTCPIFQPKLPTESPVRTDLVLGRKGTDEKLSNDQAKDFLGCISSEPQTKSLDKFTALDTDTYKKLLKRLMEKAWWQAEAASEVASAITRCQLGNGKRRGCAKSLRGDIWLLFAGPDRAGKKNMVSVLAEQICGDRPITICLGARQVEGDDEESNFRGKTAVDRITEAVQRNPFSVIVLDGVDEAGVLVQGSIKRAIERGSLMDSHGREVGMGNALFVLAGDWSMTNNNHDVARRDGRFVDEKRMIGSWRLGLIVVREKSAKRRISWSRDEDDDRSIRSRKEAGPGFLFDLNLAAAENECDKSDGSDDHNSSDVTVDHEDELSIANRNFSTTSVPHDLLDGVDDSIVFKPFDSTFVLREIKKTISLKFSMIVDENLSLEVEDDVLEKILGGLLSDETSLEEWIEKVLAPSFDRIKQQIPSDHERSSFVVRLVIESDFESSQGKSKGNGDWLPSSILV